MLVAIFGFLLRVIVVTHFLRFLAFVIALPVCGVCYGDLFLDLSSVTAGGPGVGGFTGTLGGNLVTGSITTPGGPSSFFFNAPGVGLGDSTVSGTSPQFSYTTVYSPTIGATDRVGFTSLGLASNVMTISFTSPITNPVFHAANFDWVQPSFALNPGLTSMTLLNSNGDGVDGLSALALALGTFQIRDIDPSTSDATLPSSSPPTSGGRSAYGSVQLNGTFTTLSLAIGTLGPFSDGGSFTLSVVPEPSAFILTGLALAGFFRLRVDQRQKKSTTV
jgi:hypothetical protein